MTLELSEEKMDIEEIAKIICADWGVLKEPWEKRLPSEKEPWLKTAKKIMELGLIK
jgi:hypothetical protein